MPKYYGYNTIGANKKFSLTDFDETNAIIDCMFHAVINVRKVSNSKSTVAQPAAAAPPAA